MTLLPARAALACLVSLFLLASHVLAQTHPLPPRSAPAAPAQTLRAGPDPVAVVDITYIFKNHQRFKATMEGMKKELEQFDRYLRQQHQELGKQREQLAQFKPGTPEYKNLEQRIAEAHAQLQVDTQLKRKEFLEREAKVYYQVYREVYQAVQEFADSHGISLVLRFNSEEMNPEDRQSVLEGINRGVVYQRNLYIMYEILDRLNRTAPATATRLTPPASPRVRQ